MATSASSTSAPSSASVSQASMPTLMTLPSEKAGGRKYSRRDFLKLAVRSSAFAAIAGAGGLGYVTKVEPSWVDTEYVRLLLPNLSPAFHGYRIAQLSDLHMGDWLSRTHLEEVVSIVNGLKPDLIAITGDFVSSLPSGTATDLIEVLSTLRAADGVVAVLGNHDYWTDADAIRRVLEQSSIANLGNVVHKLQRSTEALYICGVDDIWEGKARLDQVLEGLPTKPTSGAAVLLAHEPDFADTSAATGRFDLQISGHSHGGQVVIPFLGPLRLPPYGVKYPAGLYQIGTMLQYTNRGVGMIPPHVRFNCRPEITVFTLEAPQAG